jgi:hypothetical protein
MSLREQLGFQSAPWAEPWHRRAACKDYPLALFHPESSGSRDESTTKEDRAKRICARCGVRPECVAEALAGEGPRPSATHEYERRLPAGIWGGATAVERWAKDVAHIDACDGARRCHGCRPIPQRVEMLEVMFRSQAQTFLTDAESVA